MDFKCEESLQILKKLLSSASILKIPNPNEDFVVCNDACNGGMRGVPMQGNHVICYESRIISLTTLHMT